VNEGLGGHVEVVVVVDLWVRSSKFVILKSINVKGKETVKELNGLVVDLERSSFFIKVVVSFDVGGWFINWGQSVGFLIEDVKSWLFNELFLLLILLLMILLLMLLLMRLLLMELLLRNRG